MRRKASTGSVFNDTFTRITSRMGDWDSTLRSASGERAGSRPGPGWSLPRACLLPAPPDTPPPPPLFPPEGHLCANSQKALAPPHARPRRQRVREGRAGAPSWACPSPGPATPSPAGGSHRNGKVLGESLKSQKLWLAQVTSMYKQRLRRTASTNRTVQYLRMRMTCTRSKG